MKTCRACGGVLGRDCYNEQDCMAVSLSNDQYNLNEALQPYIDAIRELKGTIIWMDKNMSLDNEKLIEMECNMVNNSISLIDSLLPTDQNTNDNSDEWLPF